ncbi:trypsin-like peptidase domain-containing protein [Streptomyces sp. MST-110588]|uniref:S1C family serine protease n=1 Tax=Streptomyces sp. MST-110588 TaxID=2833628 RepID=UPI001F5C3A42|nr:trypsin-like peptidase domain-containing protein [Streptomyces sp. MST-110588]UNO40860.1 trypsin-like peptidase domain-containing protein [Streptomyces sp. MST-110588]
MSTENEGAAVPSEAEPSTAPRAPERAPESGTRPSPAPTAPPAPAAPPQAPQAPQTPSTTASAPADRPAAPPTAPPAAPPSDAPPAPGFAPTAAQGADQPPQPPHGTPAHSTPAPGTPTAAVGTATPATGGWSSPPPPPYGGGGGGDGDTTAVWGAPMPPPKPRRNGGLIAAVLVAALVAGGIGGGIGFWAAGRSDTNSSTTVSASGDPEALNRKPTSVAGIAQKALPSVVTIEAQGASGEGGTGTGFVYDKQGHILTNNHVVASAAEGGRLTATFSDGKKYDAEVVGRAQGYDVAVIKLKNASDAHLSPLPLGRSANVAVGDATIAIGAPFGLSGTVTTGIVSAKDRPVASSDGGGSSASYMSALQTDASINPGNSGGPLMDAGGNVIGINSAIQSAGGGGGFGGESQQSGSIGLGFAIPIDQAKRVADDLIRTGKPIYPQIGVQVGLKDSRDGATISRTGTNGSAPVTPGGPADKAGLKPGDTITKLDNTVIDSGPTLISEIWQHKPGDRVTLTYVRDGKEHTAQVTLDQRTGDK